MFWMIFVWNIKSKLKEKEIKKENEAAVRPNMTYGDIKNRKNVGSNWYESTKKDSWQNKNVLNKKSRN